MPTYLEGLEAQLDGEQKIAAEMCRRRIKEAIDQLALQFPGKILSPAEDDTYLRLVDIACSYSHTLTGRKTFRAYRITYRLHIGQ